MAIDLSKISKEELDAIIKEEALRRRAEMLSESKKKAQVKRLMEHKKALENELKALDEMAGMEEGIFGKLMGGGGDARRKEAIAELLNHKVKAPELLTYASPEQIAEFKAVMPNKANAIDGFVAKYGTKNDPQRADAYINALMSGNKYPKWDEKSRQYVDTAQVGGNPSNAFAEGEAQA